MNRNDHGMMSIDIYGPELILDLHECNTNKFTRNSLNEYFTQLCNKINMIKCDVHFWDDLDTPEDEKQTELHTVGTSAICFILTSNITIHTLDLMKSVYINIFSCKDFDPKVAEEFTKEWFSAKKCRAQLIIRI